MTDKCAEKPLYTIEYAGYVRTDVGAAGAAVVIHRGHEIIACAKFRIEPSDRLPLVTAPAADFVALAAAQPLLVLHQITGPIICCGGKTTATKRLLIGLPPRLGAHVVAHEEAMRALSSIGVVPQFCVGKNSGAKGHARDAAYDPNAETFTLT